MADIIKVEHLSYVYNPGMPNAVTALDDVSFTVEEGDFVGIIGATGSGKSTLITHMNGLNNALHQYILPKSCFCVSFSIFNVTASLLIRAYSRAIS